MKHYRDWHPVVKILVGIALLLMALMLPELMLVLDIGGIELLVAILLLQSKPLWLWLTQQWRTFKQGMVLWQKALTSTGLTQQLILRRHVSFFSFLWLTGGWWFFPMFLLIWCWWVSRVSGF